MLMWTFFKPCNCGSASSSASKNADIETYSIIEAYPIIEAYSNRDNVEIVEIFGNVITVTEKILICNIEREFYHNNISYLSLYQ